MKTLTLTLTEKAFRREFVTTDSLYCRDSCLSNDTFTIIRRVGWITFHTSHDGKVTELCVLYDTLIFDNFPIYMVIELSMENCMNEVADIRNDSFDLVN